MAGYQLDRAGLAGKPGPEEKEALERDYHLGLHFETLFDENEDQAGELRDPATGRPYDNSTSTDEAYIQDLEEVDLEARAERYLRRYGGEVIRMPSRIIRETYKDKARRDGQKPA